MRIKVFLNGYEHYLDKKNQVIYPSEHAINGIHFDLAHDGQTIYSNHLTKNEKEQLKKYLK